MSEKPLTYAGVGVRYDLMDPFKRDAQAAARATAGNIKRLGFTEVEMSRGESAYLVETPDSYLAQVEEGLGTKNLVADAMYQLTGRSYYDRVAQDTVAMIVNDLITLGALPISVAMHLAAGSSNWFEDVDRTSDLILGWRHACDLARCTWGGGETPTLKGIVEPSTVVLSGSAIGVIKPKSRLIRGNIEAGDVIILIESSGIHANGLTTARAIAAKLPQGYLTELPNGRTYGETLLEPTRIYVPIIEDCISRGVDIHYAVNVTGHGWRKLMRSQLPFTYVIDELPTPLPIFDFMMQHGPIELKDAYGDLNMGAGFALYVPRSDVRKVFDVLEEYEGANRFGAVIAGHIYPSARRKVVISPLHLEFTSETLAVR